MVPGQVRERGDGEPDRRRRGRRASACEETSIAQARSPASSIAPEVPCRSIASGRRALDLLLGPADHPLHGPEQAGLMPARSRIVADEERRRRLAVRAGDPRSPELGRRIAVEADRGGRHRSADVRDLLVPCTGITLRTFPPGPSGSPARSSTVDGREAEWTSDLPDPSPEFSPTATNGHQLPSPRRPDSVHKSIWAVFTNCRQLPCSLIESHS